MDLEKIYDDTSVWTGLELGGGVSTDLKGDFHLTLIPAETHIPLIKPDYSTEESRKSQFLGVDINASPELKLSTHSGLSVRGRLGISYGNSYDLYGIYGVFEKPVFKPGFSFGMGIDFLTSSLIFPGLNFEAVRETLTDSYLFTLNIRGVYELYCKLPGHGPFDCKF